MATTTWRWLTPAVYLIPCDPSYYCDEDEPNVLFLNDGTGQYSFAGNLDDGNYYAPYTIAIRQATSTATATSTW